MGKTIVILTPDCAGKQDVERGDCLAPGHLKTLLDPLGVLVHHRIDDVNERLIRVQKSVTTTQNVAFQPAFDSVLRKHLHDSSFWAQIAAILVLR